MIAMLVEGAAVTAGVAVLDGASVNVENVDDGVAI
jgi:hypothetical protein